MKNYSGPCNILDQLYLKKSHSQNHIPLTTENFVTIFKKKIFFLGGGGGHKSMVFFSVPSRDMHKDTLNNQQTKYRTTNLASVKESSQGLAKNILLKTW